MTGRKHSMCRGALAALAAWFTVSAGAVTPGAGGFSWSFQDTGLNGFDDSALAIRNGAVFPVVFTSNGDLGSLYSSGWVDLDIEGINLGNTFRASSGVDGRVAAVGSDFGAVVSVLPFTGIATVPDIFDPVNQVSERVVAVDFGPDGTLFRASQSTVAGVAANNFGNGFNGLISDVAVSPNGDVAAVTNAGFFYEYNTFVGDWLETDLNSLPGGNFGFSGRPSVTYDSLGRAHVLNDGSNGLVAADFNQQTGVFEVDTIAFGTDTSFSDIAANDFGVVGTSYIDSGTLFYAYQEGAGWASVAVDSNVDSTDQTGIAFDFEGLPVLSYSTNGAMYIAYDPIVVPEPGVAAWVLLLAGSALRRDRNRAAR